MELIGCREPECDLPAEISNSIVVGKDQDGNHVWMRPVLCIAGHRYLVEVDHATLGAT